MAQVETRDFSCRFTFSQADFDRFAVLSGDNNPIHVDPDFSARTKFGRTVAHGMLLYARISGCVSRFFPGSYQVSQELIFPSPTFAGEKLHIELTPTGSDSAGDITRVESRITRPDGIVTCQGVTAIAQLPYKPYAVEAGAPPGRSEAGSLKNLELGQEALTRRAFNHQDLQAYCDLSAELSPLYLDESFALDNGFEGLPLPGALLGGLFSYLLGTRLPGKGTNWLKQRLVFLHPIYAGDLVTAQVEVVRLRPEKDLVNLRTTADRSQGISACRGEALVLVKDLED